MSNALNSPELLRPETLERVQEAIYPARVLTQPGGAQPADPRLPPARAARRGRGGEQRQRADGPVRALPGGADPRRRLPRAAVHRRRHGAAVSDPGVDARDRPAATGSPGAVDPLDGYDELLRSAAVDAFVVTDTYRGNPQAAWLEERGVPFVAFGRPWGDPQARHPWVDVDGRAGIELAVDHLVERGHERIAWVGWQKGSFIGEDRRGGWTDRLRDHGLATSRLSARGDDTLDFGRRAAHALLESEQPTAFVCASDTLAMGVTRALHERGLRPGQDVAVTGFDDSIAAQVCTPGLTSVRQPLEQVAAEVVRCLGDLLAHRRVERQGTHPHADAVGAQHDRRCRAQ